MGRNHDLQCTEACTGEQHQTTADSCRYEGSYEYIPLTTQAVVRLDARGKSNGTLQCDHYTIMARGDNNNDDGNKEERVSGRFACKMFRLQVDSPTLSEMLNLL